MLELYRILEKYIYPLTIHVKATLLSAGLLRGSFIPPADIRELRQLTRYRKNIVEDINKQKKRIEKFLQQSGFKLSTFLSDVFGVSSTNLIKF